MPYYRVYSGKLTISPTYITTYATTSFSWWTSSTGNPPWYNSRTSITSCEITGPLTPSTSLSRMFYGCSKLTTITGLQYLDTSNVTSMYYMFYGCSVLTSVDLSTFDTSKVTSMNSLFTACSNLTSINMTGIDTSKLLSFYGMFYSCSKVKSLDLSSFDTSISENFDRMFYYCSSLETIYCNDTWTGKSGCTSENMFARCEKLVGAIPYNSSKISVAYANPTTGYFTSLYTAPKPFFGVNGKAKQIQDMYIGIGGKAKKVKEGYFGVNGIARRIF